MKKKLEFPLDVLIKIVKINFHLDDIFGGGFGGAPPVPNGASPNNATIITDHINKFFTKNSGVIYEVDGFQIGIKMEFRERLGRIQLFYGNSTQTQISNFQADVSRHLIENKLDVFKSRAL